MGEAGAPPQQQTKELYPPQETFSNGKRLNKQTRVYLMKFLWLHNVVVRARPLLAELFSWGKSLNSTALSEKLLRKWVEMFVRFH